MASEILRGPSGARRLVALCAIVLATAQLIATTAHCQASESDEQFEFQHQDIGRLSGMSSGAPQVAPQTTIVSRAQQQQQQRPQAQAHALAEPATSPLPPALAPVFERAPAAHSSPPRGSYRSSHTTGSQRKPNRITLVPRRDPMHSQAPSAAAAAAHTQAQPSGLIAAQLPAPPQQQQQQQQAQFQAPAPLAVALAEPTFAPLPVPAGPALSSFRATGGSVSARHSALIAQVAAERASAAAAASAAATGEPSLGSPAEALSSPQAVAVAAQQQQQQPQQHHAHSHQFLHQQPAGSAFAQPQLAPAQSQPAGFVNQPEEPQVAPSFEQVLGQGCPHKGVFSWENRDHCDRYYMCTNGTFTEEACPNGLAYSQQGAVYQHCAYNWNVNCGVKKTAEPIASPGCPWQFGIFPIVQAGRCSIDYFVCEWGVPDTKRCSPEGLFYDDRIKGCQWADQLGCKSETLLNFKCPPEDEDNQFWPFPRYYHSTKDVIVCVNEQPRLVHCTDEQIVDPNSLACMDIRKPKEKRH